MITDDYVMLSAHAYWDLDENGGLVDRVVCGRDLEGGYGIAPLFMWNLPPGAHSDWVVRNYGVAFNSTGPKPNRYKFELVTGAHANPLSVASISGSAFFMAPLVSAAQLGAQHWADWAHQANGGATDAIQTVTGGTSWLGFRILECPDLADAATGITVTVFLRRDV
jgi:hypothetical protein